MSRKVDSASNKNEYREYSLGDKGGRCVGLPTLSPTCADCHEIWEPEPPGTLRASLSLYVVVDLYHYLLQLQQLLLEIIKHFNIMIYCVLLAVYIRMSSSNTRTRAPTVNNINLLC